MRVGDRTHSVNDVVTALLVDGSVRFVKGTVNTAAWQALGSVSGGEVVSADSY